MRKGSAAKLPKSARAGAADLTEADVELFERLRALRLRLAQEAAVPPYVIFHDATLAAMAAARPATEEELLALPGIGEKKLATYVKAFLEEIMSVPRGNSRSWVNRERGGGRAQVAQRLEQPSGLFHKSKPLLEHRFISAPRTSFLLSCFSRQFPLQPCF